MDGELADLCKQANILNLNYIVAKSGIPRLREKLPLMKYSI